MVKYILKRMVSMVLVLITTTVLIFVLMNFVPGDPVLNLLGENATPEAVESMREAMGLNNPFLIRLGKYLLDFVRGDLGTSYRSKTSVLVELMARYPTTLKLTVLSTGLGLVIGIVAGVVSAVKQYSVFDRIATGISLFGASAPTFWVAMLLVLIFSINLGWLPPTGSYGMQYWILPVFTMGLQSSAQIMRMTRSSMLEVVRQDYVRTARAKGQTELKVIINHGLRNALIPILTVTGIRMCNYLGGSVLIETVFAMPGMGKYILDSVGFQDYPVVQGGTVWICVNCMMITFIVDVLYAFVDPRIRSMYGGKKKAKIKEDQNEKKDA